MSRRPRRRLLTAAAAATALLGGAGAAWAAPGISPPSGGLYNAPPIFTITGATPEDQVTWSAAPVGGLPVAGGTLEADGPVTASGLPDGPAQISAFNASNPADIATVTFHMDTVAPNATVTFNGTANAAGWYNALSLSVDCADPPPGSSAVVQCSVGQPSPGSGAQRAQVTAVDAAGNVNAFQTDPFRFDDVAPSESGGQPMEPVSASVVPEPPKFTWSEGVDVHSGVDHYVLQVRLTSGGPWQNAATVPHTNALEYSATSSVALPVDQLLRWRVVTVDVAGNSTASNEYLLTIDPDVAPAPKITGGPLGPTRNNSPTFTWQTTSSRWDYVWDVTAAGNPTIVRQGGGPGLNRATVPSLPDGDYTFRVVQVINGIPSASATRAFKVDTQAPAPPTITARPPFPATSPASFSWTTEPGAYSRWEVVAAGGLLAAGPSDTPLTSASIVGLAQGAYSFRVLQVDAAGNVSQWTTEPFTMIGAVLPGPPGPTASPSTSRAALPRQNARRLRPKAGKTLPTRRPVLRWTKGPRGTQLYNLQIFRVVRTKKGLTPKVRKIHSAFPRGRQYRAPMKKMLPNTCYVWRVWPYTGRKFTPKPLGVSNFCIANKKVLAKKAAAAKRKAAAKRRAAAARSARR